MEDSTQPNPTQLEAETQQEIPTLAESAPEAPVIIRNQHKKVDEPKIISFTGRATVKEAGRITEALEVRQIKTGRKHDIVRLVLALLDHTEADILQTFTTKKKT